MTDSKTNETQLAVTENKSLAVRPQDQARAPAEIQRDEKITNIMGTAAGISVAAGIFGGPVLGFALHNPIIGLATLFGGLTVLPLSLMVAALPAGNRLYNDRRQQEERQSRQWQATLDACKAAAAEIFDKALASGQVQENESYLFPHPSNPKEKLLLKITEVTAYKETPEAAEKLERITARLYWPSDDGEFSKSSELGIRPLIHTRIHPLSRPIPTLPSAADPALAQLLADAALAQAERPAPPSDSNPSTLTP